MKEATGELNMTVVTVVAIAAVMAFFYMLIWPTIKIGMALNTACSAAGNDKYTVNSDDGIIDCKDGECTYTPADGGQGVTKTCGSSSKPNVSGKK